MSASSRILLGPDDVHVWWIELDRVGNDALDVLSADERARAERFKHSRDQARWTASRAALRQILAGYAGEHPAALRLTYGDCGKPALVGAWPLRFSLAHARDCAAVAIAWGRDVGIDLERFDPGLDVSPLLAVACRQTEAERITALPPDARPEAFLSCWTLKEAYLKGIGAGLCQDPRTIEMELLPGGRATVRDFVVGVPGPQWSVRLLDAEPGWIAAVAVAGREPSVIVNHWPRLEVPAATE